VVAPEAVAARAEGVAEVVLAEAPEAGPAEAEAEPVVRAEELAAKVGREEPGGREGLEVEVVREAEERAGREATTTIRMRIR